MGLAWCFYKLCGQHGTALLALISTPDPSAQRSPSASQRDRDSGASAGFGGSGLARHLCLVPQSLGTCLAGAGAEQQDRVSHSPSSQCHGVVAALVRAACRQGCGPCAVCDMLCGLSDCPRGPGKGAEGSLVPAPSVPPRTWSSSITCHGSGGGEGGTP